jgi:hypothetical protein
MNLHAGAVDFAYRFFASFEVMNSHISPRNQFNVWLLALAAAVTPVVATAQSAGDMVRIEGKVQSGQERKKLPNTTADQVTEDRTILLTITGKAKSPETRTGTWVAYGRDMKKHDLQVLDRGDIKIDLSAGPQTFESKKFSTTYTPEHSVSSDHMGTTGRGKNAHQTLPQTKRVEAEGKKFAGYVVTVKDGDKVVGQFSDPMGLETQVK